MRVVDPRDDHCRLLSRRASVNAAMKLACVAVNEQYIDAETASDVTDVDLLCPLGRVTESAFERVVLCATRSFPRFSARDTRELGVFLGRKPIAHIATKCVRDIAARFEIFLQVVVVVDERTQRREKTRPVSRDADARSANTVSEETFRDSAREFFSLVWSERAPDGVAAGRTFDSHLMGETQ